MKQLLLFMTCLGVSPAFAQEAVVDIDNGRIAHEIVDNPLTIGVENCPCDRLKLTVDEGRLRKGPGDCQYIFTADKPGKAIFTISKKSGSGYADVGQVTYQVKPLPLPYAKVGGKHSGSMSVIIFKAQEGMIARLDGFDFDVQYKIASFKMEIIRNGQVYLDAQNDDNIFKPISRTVISHVLPGDTVNFSNIMCRKPNGTEVELEPFRINITK